MKAPVPNRIYVGNLPEDTSVAALRRRFEQCGNVHDVELAFDRGSGRMRGFAFVTMADQRSMKSAIDQLNGQLFEERSMRVVEASEALDSNDVRSGNSDGTQRNTPPIRAKITSQFRERTCMAYELDCEGVRVSFKMYPTQNESGREEWRIDASTSLAQETIITGRAMNRKAAFDLVERDFRASGAPSLDWRAIEEALGTVRALS
jgi:RNA recognition motif-containing protein